MYLRSITTFLLKSMSRGNPYRDTSKMMKFIAFLTYRNKNIFSAYLIKDVNKIGNFELTRCTRNKLYKAYAFLVYRC